MRERVEEVISNVGFDFVNSKVRVQAVEDFQAIELPGLRVGPFTKGERYVLPLWVAEELERKGIVRISEAAGLSPDDLITIHHRETGLAKGLFEIPSDFYPRLRRLLAEVEKEATRNPDKLTHLNRLRNMARDIVNVRLKKIVSLASSMARSPLMKKNLTPEEIFVFEIIGAITDAWREKVIEYASSR